MTNNQIGKVRFRSISETCYYNYPPIKDEGRQLICRVVPNAEINALTDEDIDDVAYMYGLNYGHIKAIVKVESAGSGFLIKEPFPPRPKILFEAHQFYRLTPKPVSKIRPDLSSPKWDRSLYKGGSEEWNRLLDAMEFDENPALKSASWGLGQVMGFNWELAGAVSLYGFVEEAHTGERQQLIHMMEFIFNTKIGGHLRREDWRKFARAYNGPGYARHNYHTRLANAYAKYRK